MVIDLGTINFTPEAISAAIGFVLMLVFAYFPGVRLWYAALASTVKSYIMLGLLVVAEAVVVALAHYGIITPAEPITLARILSVALALLVSNQPTYTLLPEAGDVKALRVSRDAADKSRLLAQARELKA
jgi:FtsH-binding integral membrane protein